MEITLSDGDFASYTCGERLLVSYLTAVLFLGSITAVVIIVIVLKSSREISESFRQDPKARTIKIALIASVAARVVLLSIVAPLSRSRTRLFATETSIVETGCYILTPYREV
ncbi:hypothetical protein RFM41_33135 [Mesorhizobium sp. VK25A]|uniref:G-protein coupled receptors family 3 profile domain-containing protein n=1 Tax=Mesorhizobium vachelliae TaxID=3072309 RepID=A0ABU5AEW8_9HYPH|nr:MULTISPECIES: hypothetical protein [unclassified Mesorhizobium]MDX8535816.1 hypothetical protein [Mesorhizobium sp. VK25D]MDX8548595.1 hypothetical protein [Mesorhizobium sp. VK25A]